MEEAARLPEGKRKVAEEKNETLKNTQANGNNTNQPSADAPSLSDLSKRMHCPINYKVTLPFLYDDDGKPKQTPDESLSYIPWRLRRSKDAPDVASARGSGKSSENDATGEAENSNFSPWTYLELRRHQNTAWASDRLKEGNEILFINPTRAETKFLEGLDLVPDHVDLLVAYAKLLITSNHDLAAAETKLKRALEVDPNHPLAQKTHHELVRIQQGQIRMQRQLQDAATAAPKGDFLANRNVEVAKGNGIYSDVLMERALMGDDNNKDDDDDDDVMENDTRSTSTRERRQRRKSKRDRKRKKKKKKQKRKRKRRYYSSDDDDSKSSRLGSSVEGDRDKDETEKDDGKEDDNPEKEQEKERDDNDSRDGRRHRKDRKRRKRHRKRRRRRYYYSESDDDDDSGSRSVSPKNGEDDDRESDALTNKDDKEDAGKTEGSEEKIQQEESSDDSREDRHLKDRKQRKHSDRKHRSRKKSRRHDSS